MKIIILLTAITLFSCTSHKEEYNAETNSPTEEKELPKTVKEAVQVLISEISEKDKALICSKTKEDMIQFHHGWGTYIRNTFGLWGKNSELIKDTGERHPDDASMVIIRAVWQELQTRRVRLCKSIYVGKIVELKCKFKDENFITEQKFKERIQTLNYIKMCISELENFDGDGFFEGDWEYTSNAKIEKMQSETKKLRQELYEYFTNKQSSVEVECLIHAKIQVLNVIKGELTKGQFITKRINYSSELLERDPNLIILDKKEHLFTEPSEKNTPNLREPFSVLPVNFLENIKSVESTAGQ